MSLYTTPATKVMHNFEVLLHFERRHQILSLWRKNKIVEIQKNAAKQSRQQAGKKYCVYAQHRVCFINEQVP